MSLFGTVGAMIYMIWFSVAVYSPVWDIFECVCVYVCVETKNRTTDDTYNIHAHVLLLLFPSLALSHSHSFIHFYTILLTVES